MSWYTYRTVPYTDTPPSAGRAHHHSKHAAPAHTVRVEAAAAFRAWGTINRPEKEASGTVSI